MKIKKLALFSVILGLGICLFFVTKKQSFAQSVNFQITRNIQYATRENTSANLTSLDIYASQSVKNAPVMIMIHGGGWRNGDKSNRGLNDNKVPFFNQNGFIYLSINYRLSPAVQHPGHVEDVAEAVVWVHDNISKYGGDKNKIFVMGHSAGAHLAALVATDERRLQKHKRDLSIIKGVILLDGAGYDIPAQMSSNRFFDGMLKEMYSNAFTDDVAIQKDASPFYHITKGKNIPPFLIFTAGRRLASQNQSNKMVEALTKIGVQAEAINDPAKNHGTINRQFGVADEMITQKSKEFLDGILKR